MATNLPPHGGPTCWASHSEMGNDRRPLALTRRGPFREVSCEWSVRSGVARWPNINWLTIARGREQLSGKGVWAWVNHCSLAWRSHACPAPCIAACKFSFLQQPWQVGNGSNLIEEALSRVRWSYFPSAASMQGSGPSRRRMLPLVIASPERSVGDVPRAYLPLL